MDLRKVFLGITLLCIVLLVIANNVMLDKAEEFEESCTVDYSKFVENKKCPCGVLTDFFSVSEFSIPTYGVELTQVG